MRNFLAIFILSTFSFSGFAQVEQANLLGQWSGDNIIGSQQFDNAYNEVWGIAVNNREFAIIGSTEGTHFIDVTDPSNPTEVQFVEGAVTGPFIIHRDYHDNGCFLYAVADEPTSPNATTKSTLQIIDITRLPESIEVVYDSDELIFRSHNIFIDEPNHRMYACIANGTADSNPNPDALRVYDISDPRNPKYLSTHNQLGGVNISQVHDAYLKDNIAYMNLGSRGLAIVDFTNHQNPIVLGTLDDYPNLFYNHSGWLDQSGDYYYMADERWGVRLKAVDVSDPSDLEIVKYFDAENPATTSIPHNLIVACDYLYVSYYYDGLQVYDISDPANPERVFEFDTSNEPDAQNYKGAWGVYPFLPSGNILVSDMQEGLFVFEAIDQSECAQRRQICAGVTGVNEVAQASFSMTPNPASDQIEIKTDLNLSSNFDLIIRDLSGKMILQQSFTQGYQQFSVSLPSSLASGLYLVSVQTEETTLTQKLIVE